MHGVLGIRDTEEDPGITAWVFPADIAFQYEISERFFVNDDRHDMVVAKWQNDMTDVQFWYRSVFESLDNVDDNDVIGYYGLLRQKFGGDWGMTLAGAYIDDQRASDLSGFTGTAHVDGPAGPISLAAEFAYRSADLSGSDLMAVPDSANH